MAAVLCPAPLRAMVCVPRVVTTDVWEESFDLYGPYNDPIPDPMVTLRMAGTEEVGSAPPFPCLFPARSLLLFVTLPIFSRCALPG